MNLHQQKETRDCLALLLREITERSINLPMEDSILCAVDKQIVERCRKALKAGGAA